MSRASQIEFIQEWLRAGATGSPGHAAAMAEMVAKLGDPPASIPEWPPHVHAVIQAERAAAGLGDTIYVELAAYEATGTAMHPEVERFLGKLLAKPHHRANYLAALGRLEAARP